MKRSFRTILSTLNADDGFWTQSNAKRLAQECDEMITVLQEHKLKLLEVQEQDVDWMVLPNEMLVCILIRMAKKSRVAFACVNKRVSCLYSQYVATTHMFNLPYRFSNNGFSNRVWPSVLQIKWETCCGRRRSKWTQFQQWVSNIRVFFPNIISITICVDVIPWPIRSTRLEIPADIEFILGLDKYYNTTDIATIMCMNKIKRIERPMGMFDDRRYYLIK